MKTQFKLVFFIVLTLLTTVFIWNYESGFRFLLNHSGKLSAGTIATIAMLGFVLQQLKSFENIVYASDYKRLYETVEEQERQIWITGGFVLVTSAMLYLLSIRSSLSFIYDDFFKSFISQIILLKLFSSITYFLLLICIFSFFNMKNTYFQFAKMRRKIIQENAEEKKRQDLIAMLQEAAERDPIKNTKILEQYHQIAT